MTDQNKEWWFDTAREAWVKRAGHDRTAFAIGNVRILRFDGEHEAVALAVILASRGMDSLGAMAAELEARATFPWFRTASTALLGVAAMLRRGTVQP